LIVAGEPNVRAEAEKKHIYIKILNLCTTYNNLRDNLKETITWSRNPGTAAAERPIAPDYLQQFPNCTGKTFPISCPWFIVGIHGGDMLDVVATQVSSSPSVRQEYLQCKKQKLSQAFL